MPQTQIIKTPRLNWINIINASEKEISFLQKKFKFDQLDLNDSFSHTHAQRPKLNIRPDYLFIILLFPVYNRKTREITPAEIDIFLTKNQLITIHYNQLAPLRDIFANCQQSAKIREKFLAPGSLMSLYEILDRLYGSLFPMLDHISLDINNIEKNIFAGKERQMVYETLVVKRNIVYFRKIMQAHKSILKRFVNKKLFWADTNPDKTSRYYDDLLDHTKNVWDILENYQQTIDGLEDTNTSLVSFKLNDIMRTLTIFSVIVFPLTLMAAIFGMNVNHMPIAGSNLDFWKIIAIMAAASLCMFAYFKHKKWI